MFNTNEFLQLFINTDVFNSKRLLYMINNCVYSLAQTDMTVPVRCKISTLYNEDSDFDTFSVMVLSSSDTLIYTY